MNLKNISLLIVDDENESRNSICNALIHKGYKVTETGEDKEAHSIIKSGNLDLVLLGHNSRGMDGIEFLKQIRTYDSNIAVIILAGHGNYENVLSGLHLGIVDFIHKPVNTELLDRHINAILQPGNDNQLREISIKEIMVPPDHYSKIYIDKSVVDLVDTLLKSFFESGSNEPKKNRVRSVLVYDRNEKFVGIIRFVDLLKLVLPPFLEKSPYTSYFSGMFLAQCKVVGKRYIKELVDDRLSVDIEAPIMEAIHLMAHNHLINLPVTRRGELAGIIRERDIIVNIAKNMGLTR